MGKRNGGGERLREEDMLIEVLSRLDVKTLLQCKAVSKTWYSLISNPTFIKSHLNRALTSTHSDNKVTLIVRLCKHERRRASPQQDGSYSLFQLGDCDDFVANLGFPFSRGDYPFLPPSLLIGCVCGIVCVCVDPNAGIKANWCEPGVKERTDIYIWNPATKQSKLIPAHSLHDCDDMIKATLGFGFDPIDYDFKVVRVWSRAIFPEVYSVNRNVWRNIETKLIDIPYRKMFEICLHGFLFALGHNGMMAFNLNKEVFVCDIELPVRSKHACIADFKDSIAVIIFNFKEKGDRMKLWTLDEECLRGTGVKASWTMMLTIDVGVECDFVHGLFNSVECLLIDTEWLSYNFDKKVWRYLEPYPFFDVDKLFKYTESLVPVTGSKLVNWSADEEDNEESSTDSEEVSEESSVDLEDDNEESSVSIGLEDDNEESSISIGLEDDNEESATNSEDSEDSSVDSEDDAGDE